MLIPVRICWKPVKAILVCCPVGLYCFTASSLWIGNTDFNIREAERAANWARARGRGFLIHKFQDGILEEEWRIGNKGLG